MHIACSPFKSLKICTLTQCVSISQSYQEISYSTVLTDCRLLYLFSQLPCSVTAVGLLHMVLLMLKGAPDRLQDC